MADQQQDGSDADLLRIDSLTLTFGGLRVLDRISMSVPRGIVCGLVGTIPAGGIGGSSSSWAGRAAPVRSRRRARSTGWWPAR